MILEMERKMSQRPLRISLPILVFFLAMLCQTVTLAQQNTVTLAQQNTATLAQQNAATVAQQNDVAQLAGRLKKHVETLSKDFHPRDRHHLENQAKCVKYVSEHFKKAGGKVTTQDVKYRGQTHQNVIARFGDKGGPRFIIGGHFDTVPGSPGADDNASAVAGVIELAYLLGEKAKKNELKMDFELVAYTLEEVGMIGSGVHASSLKAQKVDVVGMISLEMIGYFTDEPNSQDYPLAAMKKIYPNQGNFIAVVGRSDQKEFVDRFGTSMKEYPGIKTIHLAAPFILPDIWRSDHASYWIFGWDAVMVTDTANMRNKEYHKPTDTADRLDYQKMAHVIRGVWKVIGEMPFEEKDVAVPSESQ